MTSLAVVENEEPDADYVRVVEGVKYYKFCLEYGFGGSHWSIDIWAKDFKEAQKRVNAIKGTLKIRGQLMGKA